MSFTFSENVIFFFFFFFFFKNEPLAAIAHDEIFRGDRAMGPLYGLSNCI